jgi:UPF0716 family protein affecting phage T7 exclusion
MQFINQHSFLLAILFLLALAVYTLVRVQAKLGAYLLLGLALAGVVIAWALFRPSPTEVGDAAAVQAQIGAGLPVLLSFQSPY